MEMKNIFLIGFMGTGKSTIARHIRRKFHMEMIEMDEQIEKQEDMRITEIFKEYGEEYFRNLETELLKKIVKRENQIVSCGGGVVLREENVQMMKESGAVVLLTASPQTILERVQKNHNRPLLEGKKTVEDIRVMMENRCERYEAAADWIICVDGKESEDISVTIYEEMKRQSNE